MSILSFDGRVNIAMRLVTEDYPGAGLYIAEGIALGGPTTDPVDINQLTVTFQTMANQTVVIKEVGYGEFGEPWLIPEPILGNANVNWPIKMDLPEANRLKQDAGFTGTYDKVVLNELLGPTPTNPCFIFEGGPTQPVVSVDTVTGKVTASHVEPV